MLFGRCGSFRTLLEKKGATPAEESPFRPSQEGR